MIHVLGLRDNMKNSKYTQAQADLFYALWTATEILQDQIYDQDSTEYLFLGVLNEAIFTTWLSYRTWLS